MITQGTVFKIDGLSMMVSSVKKKKDKYIIEAEPYIYSDISIEHTVKKLLDDMRFMKTKVEVSEAIVDWFLSAKAILRQNSDILFSVKKPIFAMELRRIEREGECWHNIISVLIYSMQDKFWKENLVKCYKGFGNKHVRSGIPPYRQIKDIMLTAENSLNEELQ